MFTNLYNFFFQWLFNGAYPTYISNQTTELVCVAFCVIVVVWCVSLVFLPIKGIFRMIGGK